MKRNKTTACLLASSCICIAAHMAHGVEFRKVGGDISKAEDWGGSTITSSSYIDFINTGTYYATADVACRLFRVKTDDDVTVDASDGNPKVTINQQSGDYSIILLPKDNASFTFKGGRWDAGGGTTAYLRCCSMIDSGEAATNRSVAIIGGASVTNVEAVYVAGGNNSSAAARLAYNAFNRFAVSGDGTRLHTKNLYGAYAYVDDSVQSNNVVTISDGAIVTVTGQCVTDSRLSSVSQCRMSGNVICVSNATLRLSNTSAQTQPLVVGNAPGSTGNRFVLMGESASLDIASTGELDFFATASALTAGGNEVAFADGAEFLKASTAFGLFEFAHGDTLRITGGAKFGLADTSDNRLFSVGRWDAASSNNTLIVEDGGTLAVNYIRVTCRENALVASNATVTCAGTGSGAQDVACTVGYYLADKSPVGGVTGCRLVMRGTTPKLSAPNGGVLFRYYSHCDFEVPTEGYAPGHVPIVAKTFEIKTGCFLSATLDGYLEHGKSATYTLVETTDGVTLGSGVLDAANAALGDLGRFSVSGDGKKLLLYAKGQSGITVIIR